MADCLALCSLLGGFSLKIRMRRFSVFLITLVVLLTLCVQSAFGLIITGGEPVVNTFVPASGELGSLVIRKAVEHPFGAGYAIPETVAFPFQAELGAYYANTSVTTSAGALKANEQGVITFSVRPNAAFEIQGLEDGAVVTVTELQTVDGFAVKETASRQVTVSHSGVVTVDFINVYTPAAATTEGVMLTVNKTLSGRNWQVGDSFSFLLEQKIGEEWSAVGSQTLTVSSPELQVQGVELTSLLQTLSFPAAGTYSFRITETAGALEGITYDPAVHTVDLLVGDKDMDGKLEVQKVTASEGVTVSASEGRFFVTAPFTNRYTAPVTPPSKPDLGDLTVPITVTKRVTGRATVSPENFYFVLKNTDTAAELTQATNEEGITCFNLGFSGEDIGKTYRYTVQEVNDGRSGFEYSTKVYELTVTVSETAENTLTAALTCDGDAVNALNTDFQNIYLGMDQETAPPDDGPDTGDHFDLVTWIVILLISAAVLVVLVVLWERHNDHFDRFK